MTTVTECLNIYFSGVIFMSKNMSIKHVAIYCLRVCVLARYSLKRKKNDRDEGTIDAQSVEHGEYKWKKVRISPSVIAIWYFFFFQDVEIGFCSWQYYWNSERSPRSSMFPWFLWFICFCSLFLDIIFSLHIQTTLATLAHIFPNINGKVKNKINWTWLVQG